MATTKKKKSNNWESLPLWQKILIIGVPTYLVLDKIIPDVGFEEFIDFFDECQTPPQRLPVSESELSMPLEQIYQFAVTLYQFMDNPALAGSVNLVCVEMLKYFNTPGDYRALNNLWEARIDNQGESVFCWLKGEFISTGDAITRVLGDMHKAGLDY